MPPPTTVPDLEASRTITEEERSIIVRCARKYRAARILLFGSSVKKGGDAPDIDLGVDGVDPRRFFDLYAELIRELPRPVDLVDLSKRSLFTQLVEDTGVLIYG